MFNDSLLLFYSTVYMYAVLFSPWWIRTQCKLRCFTEGRNWRCWWGSLFDWRTESLQKCIAHTTAQCARCTSGCRQWLSPLEYVLDEFAWVSSLYSLSSSAPEEITLIGHTAGWEVSYGSWILTPHPVSAQGHFKTTKQYTVFSRIFKSYVRA